MVSAIELLAERVRSQGARPLFTQYAGEHRTELSAATFANWVDKTTNWLAEADLADLFEPESPAPVVGLPLAQSQPAHWMTFAWVMSAWQAGLAVAVPAHPQMILVVGGPGITAQPGAPETVSCSLHPLALPGSPRDGVLDWSDEVRPQPDVHDQAPPDPDRLAWIDHRGSWTLAELLDDETRSGASAGSVLITETTDPWIAVRDGLLRPLIGGGSAVLAPGVPESELTRIRKAERIG